MWSRATGTLFFLSQLFFWGLFGCSAGKPTVWINQQGVFSDYKGFEIRPVFNATGKPVNPELLSVLTNLIKIRLQDKQLLVGEVNQPRDGLLVVKSDLVILVICEPMKVVKILFPSFAGKTQCTLRTRLIDKETNRIMAEITTTREAGGCSLNPLKTYEWIFDEVAKDIAEEVALIMLPEDSGLTLQRSKINP